MHPSRVGTCLLEVKAAWEQDQLTIKELRAQLETQTRTARLYEEQLIAVKRELAEVTGV